MNLSGILALGTQTNPQLILADDTNTYFAVAESGNGSGAIGIVCSNTSGVSGASQIYNMVSLTQAEYDAIGTPDEFTYYVIIDSPPEVVDLNTVSGRLALSNFALASTGSIILGRGTGSGGDFQEINIGSGLYMSGSTLYATGGGGAGITGTGGGDLLSTNNLSDLSDISTARDNLGLGSGISGAVFGNLTVTGPHGGYGAINAGPAISTIGGIQLGEGRIFGATVGAPAGVNDGYLNPLYVNPSPNGAGESPTHSVTALKIGIGAVGQVNASSGDAIELHIDGTSGTQSKFANYYIIDAGMDSNRFRLHPSGDIETTATGVGLILRAPNGTRYRFTVDNSGVLSAVSV